MLHHHPNSTLAYLGRILHRLPHGSILSKNGDSPKPGAVQFKVRLDLGVGIVDYRALYKNPGA